MITSYMAVLTLELAVVPVRWEGGYLSTAKVGRSCGSFDAVEFGCGFVEDFLFDGLADAAVEVGGQVF